ncbi:MAG: PqqD family protein [Bryobacteraceae bacterium]|nr:PqqD family protein [Bryobacteraceae bacterium]
MQTYQRRKDVNWRLDEKRCAAIEKRLRDGDPTGNRAVVVLSLGGTLYDLDLVGARIWLALEKPQTADDIAERLAPDFAVGQDELARDVAQFLNDLKVHSLIEEI